MRAVLLLMVVASASASSVARAEDALPTELEGIGIVDKPGALVNKELRFTRHDGKEVTLGSYFDGKRPLVLVLAYYKCPMLCTLVINGVTDGMKGLEWTAGDKYRVVTVSIDPSETPDLAHAKRENHLRSYGRDVGEDSWDFLVGSEAAVKALTQSVGFNYRWDEASKQWAHAAGAFILTPDGKLSRTLYGIEFRPGDLRLALLEASEGKLGTTLDRVLLFCFHYDPSARSYVLAASRLMTAGGVVTVLLLGLFLAALWRKDPAPSVTVAERTS